MRMPLDVHDRGAVPPGPATLPARKVRRAQRAAKRATAARRRFLRDRAELLAARRRTAAVILASCLGLAATATGFSAWAASRYDGDHLQWWWGVGGRYSHHVDAVAVETGHAAVFALEVTGVPVVLAALTFAALHLPRTRDRYSTSVPAWIGAYVAPGLAVGVVASFAASLLGQTESRDFLPALASVAPLGLPLLAFFAAAPFLVRRERRRGGRKKPGPARR